MTPDKHLFDRLIHHVNKPRPRPRPVQHRPDSYEWGLFRNGNF
ncbi:hypothetical protein [Nocardioides sp. Kera G14]|nr:hypothetical protein [Nocardioides sp. Kera G14]